VIRALSLDVWGTLLRANPAFKVGRVSLVAEALGTGPDETAVAMEAAAAELDEATLETGQQFGCADRLHRAAVALGVRPLSGLTLTRLTFRLGLALRRDPPTLTEPDLPDALNRFRVAGLRLAVTSNTGFISGAQMRSVLDSLGLRVDHHVFSDEVGHAKPAPEIFARLVGVLGCRPEEVLHVGDSRRADVLGAREAGLHALWYRPDGERADGVVRALVDVGEQIPQFG
jgi:putative hydrolase of the HAD superfamily